MRWLYTLSVRLYTWSILLVSPFNKKAKKWIEGRKHWKADLSSRLPANKEVIWFHVASLGEFEQARPIMEKIKAKTPDCFLLITFFSPSGFEVRKNYELADHVCYLPTDTRKNARQFTALIQPKMAFFIKYEFWFNFLKELKISHTPTYLVSGIFRPKQHFFQWYGKWFSKQLEAFTHFFVQNEESASLLSQIGYKNVLMSGDTRFDRVLKITQNKKEFPLVKKFAENSTTIVIGSNWPKDDDLLIPYINAHLDRYKFIIAPHNLEEQQLLTLAEKINTTSLRYSKTNEQEVSSANVLIIDTMGMLSSIYQYGKWAYIGGGFGANVHNILEAATYGLPTVFGPNYRKFQECKDLLSSGGAFCIHDLNEFTTIADQLEDQDQYDKASKEAGKYVLDKSGATDLITNLLKIG